MKLGEVEPFLRRLGLDPPVLFEQFGEMKAVRPWYRRGSSGVWKRRHSARVGLPENAGAAVALTPSLAHACQAQAFPAAYFSITSSSRSFASAS